MIGQRKAFYSQRIPESSCARKETVDIDILVTSRNGDRTPRNGRFIEIQSNFMKKKLHSTK